jgi:Fe-S-cluster containining protein
VFSKAQRFVLVLFEVRLRLLISNKLLFMVKRSIDKTHAPFYLKEPLRFECTSCGACCIANGDYYVYVSQQEIAKICELLAVSRAWFKRRYLQRLPEGDWVLAVNDNETCVFLGKAQRCRVYSARPGQCLSYPYWPEVVMRRQDWVHESRRCEGIGRGKVVSKKMIAALLGQQLENEV